MIKYNIWYKAMPLLDVKLVSMKDKPDFESAKFLISLEFRVVDKLSLCYLCATHDDFVFRFPCFKYFTRLVRAH